MYSRQACMCVCACIQVLSQCISIHLYVHTYVHTVYTCTVCTHVCMYVIVLSLRDILPLLPPLAVSKVYRKTTCVHTYIHTYIHMSLPFLLGSGLSLQHSCHLRHWQQSTTSPLSTLTCWQTTDTTPSTCGRASSSTWVRQWCGWWQCVRKYVCACEECVLCAIAMTAFFVHYECYV